MKYSEITHLKEEASLKDYQELFDMGGLTKAQFDRVKATFAEKAQLELLDTPTPTPRTAPKSTKPVIAMLALHYFNVTDNTAKALIANKIPVKQDRNGKWYLPEYTTSGTNFDLNLKYMIDHYGNPRTIDLQKRR